MWKSVRLLFLFLVFWGCRNTLVPGESSESISDAGQEGERVNIEEKEQCTLSLTGKVEVIIREDMFGHQNGPFERAKFHWITDVAFLGGDMFLLEPSVHILRKVLSFQTVEVAAGTHRKAGLKDGHAKEALFFSPLTMETYGDKIYIVGGNHSIRVYHNNKVETYAGNGEPGFRDGKGKEARFNIPTSLAIDRKGGIYVADLQNFRIRYIDTERNVTTLGGSGVHGYDEGKIDEISLPGPIRITLDEKDDIYYTSDHALYAVTEGVSRLLAGNERAGFQDGAAKDARFKIISDIKVRPGHQEQVFLADKMNHRVRVYDGKTDCVYTLLGKGTFELRGGSLEQARISHPSSVVFTSENVLWISGGLDSQLLKVTLE